VFISFAFECCLDLKKKKSFQTCGSQCSICKQLGGSVRAENVSLRMPCEQFRVQNLIFDDRVAYFRLFEVRIGVMIVMCNILLLRD
jgi:hypothetical protein